MNPSVESVSDYASRAEQLLRDIGFGVHESQIILALSSVERATVSDLSTTTKYTMPISTRFSHHLRIEVLW